MYVNKEVLRAIGEGRTIRIVVDIPTNVLDPGNLSRLLVVDVYPKHTYVLIDINNRRYDYHIAHKQTYIVPIYILRLSRNSSTWIFFRRAIDDQRTAKDLAELHWCNGQNPIPFLVDQYQGTRRPRRPRLHTALHNRCTIIG
ncbi:hypothetical protein BDV32DRAFT_139705 [Aspergillus pseudonomiae]|nr:hypothetical protein BDV32DRAFT_139705 [Aspergillus pseudonomiae]